MTTTYELAVREEAALGEGPTWDADAPRLIWVDILSRVVLAPAELPLGVLTAAIGGPCFVLLMRRRTYTFGGV